MTPRQLQVVEFSGGSSTVTDDMARVDYVTLIKPNYVPVTPARFAQVKSAEVTFDSTWTPFVQATLVLVLPASSELAAWDPRTGVRIGFSLRSISSSGTLNRPFSLMIRSRSIDWAAGEMTITACSDEIQLQDYATGTAHTWGSAQPFDGVLAQNLSALTYGTGLSGWQLAAGAPNPSIPAADQTWPAAVPAWDFVSGLADANNIWLVGDELGNMWQAPVGYNFGDSTTHYLNDATMIKNVVDVINRDDPAWANAIAITYNGQVAAAAGAAQIVATTIGDQTYRKVLYVQSPNRAPSNAAAAATKLVTAASKRGQTLTVTALADLSAYPCNVWSVAWLDQTHVGTCRAVTFHLPDGTMDLTLNVTS